MKERPDPRTEHLEEGPQSEPELEEDPLASSLTIGSFDPIEPQQQNPASTAIESFFSSILSYSQPQIPEPNPSVSMASMDVDKDNDVKEIKLSPPKQFDGDRNKFRKFLQDAELYMTINQKIYKDDLTKIGFVLSFMKEGQAAAWADQFVEHAMAQPKPATGLLNLGTYTTFRKDLIDAFSAFDTPGDALDQMKTLRMKNGDSIDEHIAKFKMLLAESKLSDQSAAVIDLFRETLTVPLQQ